MAMVLPKGEFAHVGYRDSTKLMDLCSGMLTLVGDTKAIVDLSVRDIALGCETLK